MKRSALTVLVLAACSKADPPLPYPLPTPGDLVHVRADAQFHTTAKSGATSAIAGGPDDGPLAFRATSIDGEWVEIEPLLTWSGECAETPDGLEGLRVTLRVRTRDLRPLLIRPLSLQFDDGTSVELSAGAVIGDRTAGGLRTLCSPSCVEVPVPEDAIGLGYVPEPEPPLPLRLGDRPPKKAPPPDVPSPRLKENTTAEIDGRAMEIDGSEPLQAVEARGERALISIHGDCARWQVLVPADAITTEEPGYESSNFGNTLRDPGSFVAAGAPLTWPDGSLAGKVLHDRAFGQLVDRGDRVCVDRPIRLELATPKFTIPLCVPRSAILDL